MAERKEIIRQLPFSSLDPKLLSTIKECQELIYKHLNQEYQKKSFTITNNDILNSVFIGFFIILVLDIFVKIGKLYSTKY